MHTAKAYVDVRSRRIFAEVHFEHAFHGVCPATAAKNSVCVTMQFRKPKSAVISPGTGYMGRAYLATYHGTPVGVFARQYFDGSVADSWQCRTGSWADGIYTNGDGTYSIKTAESDGVHVMFDAFKFENHSGSCYYRDGTKYSYTAVKQ